MVLYNTESCSAGNLIREEPGQHGIKLCWILTSRRWITGSVLCNKHCILISRRCYTTETGSVCSHITLEPDHRRLYTTKAGSAWNKTDQHDVKWHWILISRWLYTIGTGSVWSHITLEPDHIRLYTTKAGSAWSYTTLDLYQQEM